MVEGRLEMTTIIIDTEKCVVYTDTQSTGDNIREEDKNPDIQTLFYQDTNKVRKCTVNGEDFILTGTGKKFNIEAAMDRYTNDSILRGCGLIDDTTYFFVIRKKANKLHIDHYEYKQLKKSLYRKLFRIPAKWEWVKLAVNNETIQTYGSGSEYAKSAYMALGADNIQKVFDIVADCDIYSNNRYKEERL